MPPWSCELADIRPSEGRVTALSQEEKLTWDILLKAETDFYSNSPLLAVPCGTSVRPLTDWPLSKAKMSKPKRNQGPSAMKRKRRRAGCKKKKAGFVTY